MSRHTFSSPTMGLMPSLFAERIGTPPSCCRGRSPPMQACPCLSPPTRAFPTELTAWRTLNWEWTCKCVNGASASAASVAVTSPPSDATFSSTCGATKLAASTGRLVLDGVGSVNSGRTITCRRIISNKHLAVAATSYAASCASPNLRRRAFGGPVRVGHLNLPPPARDGAVFGAFVLGVDDANPGERLG